MFWLYCGGTQTLVFGNGGIGVEEARICGLKWSLVYVLGVISVNGTKLEKVRKCENLRIFLSFKFYVKSSVAILLPLKILVISIHHNLISRKISLTDCQIYTLQFSYIRMNMQHHFCDVIIPGEVVEYMEVLTDVGCNVDLLDELKCGTEGVMASQVLTASRKVLMWYK